MMSMRTVQLIFDEELLIAVDAAVAQRRTSRSAFARQALQEALDRLRDEELERRHRAGYERHPVEPGEFGAWHDEQVWPE